MSPPVKDDVRRFLCEKTLLHKDNYEQMHAHTSLSMRKWIKQRAILTGFMASPSITHTHRKSIPFYTIFYDNGTSNEYALVIWIWNLLVLYTWTDCYNPKMKIKPVKYWLPYVLLILEVIDLNKPLSLHNTFGAQLWAYDTSNNGFVEQRCDIADFWNLFVGW